MKSLDRVEELLNAFDRPQTPAAARARAEELVRELVQLYGSGIAKMLEIVDEAAGASGERVFARLIDDPLVSALLAIHGLHPLSPLERVERAVESVRPYIESHQGHLEVVGVEESTALVRMSGSCHGCPSSAVTLKEAIERAILESCPDITTVRAESVEAEGPLTLRVIDAATA